MDPVPGAAERPTNMHPERGHRRLVFVTDRRVPLVVRDLAEVVDAVQAVPNVGDDVVFPALGGDVALHPFGLGLRQRDIGSCARRELADILPAPEGRGGTENLPTSRSQAASSCRVGRPV